MGKALVTFIFLAAFVNSVSADTILTFTYIKSRIHDHANKASTSHTVL